MNLILLDASEVTNSTAVLSMNDERAKHITKHLRKKTGDTVQVGVVNGGKHTATVTLSENGTKSLTLSLSKEELPQEEFPRITLVLALPFPDRLKYLWPVVATMGVQKIVVLKATLSNEEHVVSRSLRPETYNRLIREGLSQGGHTQWPEVIVDVKERISLEQLEKYVGSPKKRGTNVARVFLDCGEETIVPPSVRTSLLQQLAVCRHMPTPSAVVAVGPNRGWTEQESKLFQKAGFKSALMGPSIMRVDTAVVAGIAQVQAALQEVSIQQKYKRCDLDGAHECCLHC